MKKIIEKIVTETIIVCDSCEKKQTNLKQFLSKLYCEECRIGINSLDLKKPPPVPCTYEEVSQFLGYQEPNKLFWKVNQTHTAKAGDRAGHSNYKYVTVWGRVHKVDEIIHLLKYKKYPNENPFVEYKSPRSPSPLNHRPREFGGIYFRKERNKWEARIKMNNGSTKHLGTFSTELEAREMQRLAMNKQIQNNEEKIDNAKSIYDVRT